MDNKKKKNEESATSEKKNSNSSCDDKLKSKQKSKEDADSKTKTEKSKDDGSDLREDKKMQKLLSDKDKELEKLNQELEEQKDRHLRLLAEYDNYRKRTQSEKDASYGYAVADVAEKLLPVLDNLERSLAAAADDTSSFCEGVRMIERQFREALEKLGVTEIPSLGKTFDPDLHNAIMHDEDAEKGENEIVEVFQKGYAIGNKVIRHSMVKVVN